MRFGGLRGGMTRAHPCDSGFQICQEILNIVLVQLSFQLKDKYKNAPFFNQKYKKNVQNHCDKLKFHSFGHQGKNSLKILPKRFSHLSQIDIQTHILLL